MPFCIVPPGLDAVVRCGSYVLPVGALTAGTVTGWLHRRRRRLDRRGRLAESVDSLGVCLAAGDLRRTAAMYSPRIDTRRDCSAAASAGNTWR